MSTIISKRFLPRRTEKFNLLPVYLIFMFVMLNQGTTAQICDKKTMIFFDTDQFSIKSSEEQKLSNLTKLFSQKTDTFLLEIYAFTDSIASVEYNYKLAKNRFKSIVAYLKKNSSAHFEIIEKVRGEAAPLKSNATEEGRAKNRRVEIFYFRISEGRITLKGKGGMEMTLGRNYFGPCGICETNPKLTEIYSDEEAERAGVPLTTMRGCQLTTVGMINLSTSNCKDGPKPDKNVSVDPKYCTDIAVKIPASKFDEEIEIWSARVRGSRNNDISKWDKDSTGQLEYDEKTKMYTLMVKFCPGDWINLDKCKRANGERLNFIRDSAGVVAIPELTRWPNKRRKYVIIKSTVLSNEGEKPFTIARFYYRGKGQVAFTDSGMSKEKIGYYFTGTLDKYERECDSGRCARLNECWCFEIPLSDYTKLIYFQKNKNYRLKVPMKYRNYSIKLYIPGADTIIPVTAVKRSKRKYTFQLPLPDTYVVLYKKGNDPNNKRKYDHQVDLEKVKTKYSKRKHLYKARIKRRQLKNPV